MSVVNLSSNTPSTVPAPAGLSLTEVLRRSHIKEEVLKITSRVLDLPLGIDTGIDLDPSKGTLEELTAPLDLCLALEDELEIILDVDGPFREVKTVGALVTLVQEATRLD